MDKLNKFGFIMLGITGITLIFTIIFTSITSNRYENDNRYNNGICIKCGGSYEYLDAVGYRDIYFI